MNARMWVDRSQCAHCIRIYSFKFEANRRIIKFEERKKKKWERNRYIKRVEIETKKKRRDNRAHNATMPEQV